MIKLCKKPGCNKPVEFANDVLCPVHYREKLLRSKREEAIPKCACGNCLSLERQQAGIKECPTCEENQPSWTCPDCCQKPCKCKW